MQAFGLTDPGAVRTENQDVFAIEQLEDGSILAVVCDGMGGAKAGNVASHLALEVFTNEVKRSMDARLTEEEIALMLDGAAALANNAVYEQASVSRDYSGMGTTLVAALVRENIAYFLNVGDSRAYHLEEDDIHLVTVDHSVVEMMIRRGEITREEARRHPVKNLITRAIGTMDTVQTDLFREELAEGDSLLLCSDGLSNLLNDQEILFEVSQGSKEDCCRRLVDIVMSRGAPDNVTAVLVTCDD